MPSPRSAAASARSTRGRSARARGAKSIVIWPPSPRRRSWRGSSAAAARFAFSAAAGERSAPVLTSTATSARVGSIDHRALAERHGRAAERLDLLPDAGVGQRRRRLAHGVAGLAPVAQRLGRGARRRAQAGRATPGRRRGPPSRRGVRRSRRRSRRRARRPRRVRRMRPRPGSAPAIAAAASAARAARRSASRSERAMFIPGAPGVRIAVRPLRSSRGGHRWRLAGLGPAGDLHQERPSRGAAGAGRAGSR